jgi:arabinose-5-phosphate isomerase
LCAYTIVCDYGRGAGSGGRDQMTTARTRRQALKTDDKGKLKRSRPVASGENGDAPRKVAKRNADAATARPAKVGKVREARGNAKTHASDVVKELKRKTAKNVARTRNTKLSGAKIARSAKRTLKLEVDGLNELLAALSGRMAQPFAEAVRILGEAHGRVIVTGIGKSGHIGQKIAATLASTGTTAHFVHPSEASHGDLGMITRDDAVLAISWSGETVELGNILTHTRRFAVPLIAITSKAASALGKAADVVLQLPKAPEACPHGLAPTTSTTMTLALGDCLSIALLEAKGFTAEDFKQIHPGGSLGAQLKFVSDIMHADVSELPLVKKNVQMTEAIVTMTQKAFGCLGVVDGRGKLVGVITDGDLRRHMHNGLLGATTGEIMTKAPKTIRPDILASAALEQINTARITALFVVEKGKPVGIVHVHDLLRVGF